MTREEAIKVLEKQFDKSCGNYRYQNAEKLDFKDALWMAISALRQQEHFRDLTKKVEPLTLDELRKMDGEPAWFVSLHDGFASWGIVRVVEMSKVWFIAVAGAERAFGDLDGYGKTWLAYRHKPEEGTD